MARLVTLTETEKESVESGEGRGTLPGLLLFSGLHICVLFATKKVSRHSTKGSEALLNHK